jgi:MFS family permease
MTDNYGPRWLIIIGVLLNSFGLMMTSISKEYYQIALAQGICSPLGASMLFYPCLSATMTWFYKRRGFAVGIAASGSGLGGVIFPIMVTKLMPQVGFGWTMRILAFLILCLGIITCLTVTSRLPPVPRPVRFKDFVEPLKDTAFSLTALAAFVTFLGKVTTSSFILPLPPYQY